MVGELIRQLPEEQALLALLERFEKLLQKYARILDSEDAYEDMQLYFMELVLSMKSREVINKTEGEIINYINVGIKNHYIALSKARKTNKEICFSDLSEEQSAIIEEIAAEETPVDIADYFPNIQVLTANEKKILYQLYVEGYTASEIAKRAHVSRQYIHKAELRAIDKIRKNYLS